MGRHAVQCEFFYFLLFCLSFSRLRVCISECEGWIGRVRWGVRWCVGRCTLILSSRTPAVPLQEIRDTRIQKVYMCGIAEGQPLHLAQ